MKRNAPTEMTTKEHENKQRIAKRKATNRRNTNPQPTDIAGGAPA